MRGREDGRLVREGKGTTNKGKRVNKQRTRKRERGRPTGERQRKRTGDEGKRESKRRTRDRERAVD